MSARERVEAAIEAAQVESAGRPMSERMLALVQAGLQALADEIDADGRAVGVNAPPPVHVPPRDVGAVVLGLEVRGVEFNHPVLLVRTSRPSAFDIDPWWSAQPIDGYEWHSDENLQAWVPAQVVRADDSGPVAALREVVRLLDRDAGSWSDAAADAQQTAVNALARLENSP